MFGVDGFSLRPREAVGISMTAEGLRLVRLAAPEERNGAWTVTASSGAACSCDGADTAALAAAACVALRSLGWAHLPLGLALPVELTMTAERELPAALTGAELQAALLWAMRAEADREGRTLPADLRLCCAPMETDANTHRYWTAAMTESRVQAYFSAFSVRGLRLRRLTICPPDGGTLAPLIAAALDPRMPWEEPEERTGECAAIYAGLLVPVPSSPLSWHAEHRIFPQLRRHAPELTAGAATLIFAAAVSVDAAGLMAERTATETVQEELRLHDADVRRMEDYAMRRAAVAERERVLAEVQAESLPLRALLVHLGTLPLKGIHLTALRVGQMLEIEGEAESYEALATMTEHIAADGFFRAPPVLAEASREDGHIRFVLRTDGVGL
ncbi:fimbrial assembly protein [uncultured Selenomonas sp.]|uniref:PilN domain-containing protein n=1 Tax=uncultured Selenomonas sp. TaxID=159275 RepID=UPI0028DC3882|nr:fimbrial assembly protein [uncultured Selenomonas sp.]